MGHFKFPLLYDGGMTVKGLKQSTEFDTYLSDSEDDGDENEYEYENENESKIDNEQAPGLGSDQAILRASKDIDAIYTAEQLAEYSIGEINRKAIALFDFSPENDNEVRLREGQIIWISYRHGQGWLVAEDPITGEHGLVPEAYVDVLQVAESTGDDDDAPKRFLPEIFDEFSSRDSEDEWVDTDFEENVTENMARTTLHD